MSGHAIEAVYDACAVGLFLMVTLRVLVVPLVLGLFSRRR